MNRPLQALKVMGLEEEALVPVNVKRHDENGQLFGDGESGDPIVIGSNRESDPQHT